MVKHIMYDETTYGTIVLNRPDKRNAISSKMAHTLNNLLAELKNRPPKFLVIKSAGDSVFCAGGDLTELHGGLDEVEAYKRLSPMREVLYKLATFPVPTICLLQGNAFGGGCELATSCDFRIAKEGTLFGFIQTNLGILPGWGGGALLYKKVQPNFAFQWITEGAIFPANLLHKKGWLHHVVSAEKWADEATFLKQYTNKSKEQLTFLKQQFMENVQLYNIKDEMERESRESAHLWPSDEHKRAVNKFLNKS